MKKNILVVFIAFALVSIFSVFSLVRNSGINSFNGIECNAQGDIMPEPYNQLSDVALNSTICSAQGDIKPTPWVVEEDEEEDEGLVASGQGDIKPTPWIVEE
ncbi:MAG: hypothetical protein DRI23_12340, partial [Candidatus Cloacimonadota bacterium]